MEALSVWLNYLNCNNPQYSFHLNESEIQLIQPLFLLLLLLVLLVLLRLLVVGGRSMISFSISAIAFTSCFSDAVELQRRGNFPPLQWKRPLTTQPHQIQSTLIIINGPCQIFIFILITNLMQSGKVAKLVKIISKLTKLIEIHPIFIINQQLCSKIGENCSQISSNSLKFIANVPKLVEIVPKSSNFHRKSTIVLQNLIEIIQNWWNWSKFIAISSWIGDNVPKLVKIVPKLT